MATRIEALRAEYEEYGEAETAGRIAYHERRDLPDNPHWEARTPYREQPSAAREWHDAWTAEYVADTTRAAKERRMGFRTTKEIAMAQEKPLQIGDLVTVGVATEAMVLVAMDGEDAFVRYDEGTHKICRIVDLERAHSRAWYQIQGVRQTSRVSA